MRFESDSVADAEIERLRVVQIDIRAREVQRGFGLLGVDVAEPLVLVEDPGRNEKFSYKAEPLVLVEEDPLREMKIFWRTCVDVVLLLQN